MKISEREQDERTALWVESRDAEHHLRNLERAPHGVRLIIRRDEERKYEEELRERAAKEAPDAAAH